MNYIVVDFEWNQTSYGKGSENRKIPFEIIEIGAVKLNEKRKEVDRFSRTIRPKVYKKLHYITKELTGITQEELNVSDPWWILCSGVERITPFAHGAIWILWNYRGI